MNLKCDILVSTFGFKCNLYRYKASNANAANKLDKVRARAEAAERAAGANGGY